MAEPIDRKARASGVPAAEYYDKVTGQTETQSGDVTIEGQTDAQPLLDAEAEKTQPLLDEGWRLWEELGEAQE
mgnify:CR=1 FL=1